MSTQSKALRLAEKLLSPAILYTHDRAQIAAELRRLHAENEALRESITKANAQAERFEREWYLRGDQIEAQAALLRQSLEALEKTQRYGINAATFQTTTAIRQHLEGKQ